MKRKFFIVSLLIAAFSFVTAEEMPEGYYDNINGKKDAELKGTLKNIIRKHTAIPYGSGKGNTWEVFYYSDRDSNGYCMDMYCDTWQKFTSPGAAVSGCNIEHSLANSWWGGTKNDQYKDCYLLNPSNSNANSARSNYPPGVPEMDNIKIAGSMRIGQVHHDSLNVDFYVFEPKDEYKGDFARTYFYVVTCYGRDLEGKYPDLPSNNKKPEVGWRLSNKDVGSRFAMQNDNHLEFQPWLQKTLIEWHRMDPVSEKEVNRMDAVSDFQHNRNPFIDYPYLAEYIWGEKAGEEVDMSRLMASSDPDFELGKSNGWRDEKTALEPVMGQVKARKMLINGELYIEMGEVVYTITGLRVR